MNAAPQIFEHVVSALDAETIQGQTAERVVHSTRNLLALTGLNIQQLARAIPPEKLPILGKHFT